jgi:hypothetical protein
MALVPNPKARLPKYCGALERCRRCGGKFEVITLEDPAVFERIQTKQVRSLRGLVRTVLISSKSF